MNAETPVHVAEQPLVVHTSSGTIVMELSGPHAVVLAKVLARYDATRTEADQVPGYSPAVWLRTVVSLMTQTAFLRYAVAETVDVDASLVDLVEPSRQLHVVGGGSR